MNLSVGDTAHSVRSFRPIGKSTEVTNEGESLSVHLPSDIDASKKDAKYKDGVLKIEMTETKEAASKKIEVKTT